VFSKLYGIALPDATNWRFNSNGLGGLRKRLRRDLRKPIFESWPSQLQLTDNAGDLNSGNVRRETVI